MAVQILLVEDEPLIRQNLRRLLERHDFQVTEAGCVAEACSHPLQQFAAIITDVRLPGESGLSLIARARPVPVVVMTSYEDTRQAVDALRNGAVHYLIKPFDFEELRQTLQHALVGTVSAPVLPARPASSGLDELVGQSPAMQRLYADIRQVASAPTTVLIQGESGTGKELVARALHRLSPRAQHPMIAVNCAAIPETLIEDELFGHEKGAFTGAHSVRKGLVEAADQGTLFLDEIGELPLEAQARLLRLLQEKEIRRIGTHQTRKVNLRLVAATHRDLAQMVQEGSFRTDLYFRLNVVALQLPPLRERLDDLPALCQHLLQQLCQQHHRPVLSLTAAALQRLAQHPWPGNIRELQNVLEYAVLMNRGPAIDVADLRLQAELPSRTAPAPALSQPPPTAPASAGRLLDQQFVQLVRQLEQQYNETDLAQQLGISRKTLWEKRQRLGIPRQPRRRLPPT